MPYTSSAPPRVLEGDGDDAAVGRLLLLHLSVAAVGCTARLLQDLVLQGARVLPVWPLGTILGPGMRLRFLDTSSTGRTLGPDAELLWDAALAILCRCSWKASLQPGGCGALYRCTITLASSEEQLDTNETKTDTT